MALLRPNVRFGSESLESWQCVGSGGFGCVYKARHKDWGFDVAIKILHDGVCTFMPKEKALSEEVTHMDTASSEFVLRVHGMYEGPVPPEGSSVQKGIVMDFMGGDSVQSLLRRLPGRPPWALAFRLAHQVALGMNFLHSKKLIHCDLKPSNVLLSDDFNAKLADFGLSRVSRSALSSNTERTENVGGTYKYMPPEAFQVSYEPAYEFDRYSYGILLWSIVTGKEPYPCADSCLVALKIPEGDRPPCDQIIQRQVEGLKELVDLMQQCWDGDPRKRPTFKGCLEVTEKVFLHHKREIPSAIDQVLTRLEQSSHPLSQNGSVTSIHCSNKSVLRSSSPQTTEQPVLEDVPDVGRSTTAESSAAQESVRVPTITMSDADKAKFIDVNRPELVQRVSEVMALVDELGDMVHSETYSVIEAKQTSQEKMRTLYRTTFRSGGRTVKAAFYTILQRHHAKLVEDLSGSS